tara:strand:+ start:366 stop:563 length:198 start_codon:yes stop_codon:yes gene_type:complete
MENNADGIDKPSQTKTDPQKNTSSYITPVLMLLGVITATLSVIVAGYIHGNMHIEAVYHSLTNFT